MWSLERPLTQGEPQGERSSSSPARDRSGQAWQTLGVVIPWTYGLAIRYGVLRADDSTLCAIEEAGQAALRASSDIAVIFTEYALGGALLCRDAAADRHRGLELAMQAREWQRKRMPSLVPVTELMVNHETAASPPNAQRTAAR
jgi:hypothetical protein